MAQINIGVHSSVCYAPVAPLGMKQQRLKRDIGNRVGRVEQILPTGAMVCSFAGGVRKDKETGEETIGREDTYVLSPANLRRAALSSER